MAAQHFLLSAASRTLSLRKIYLGKTKENDKMVDMSETLSFVVPLLLLCLTVALPTIRRTLERKARETEFRDELVQEFHQSAMTVLKNTNPKDHAEMREVVMTAGAMMMDGTRLVRGMVFYHGKVSSKNSERKIRNKEVFDSLPEDVRHAFAKALGVALLVSSCNSLFLARLYRSVILLILSEDEREIRQPA